MIRFGNFFSFSMIFVFAYAHAALSLDGYYTVTPDNIPKLPEIFSKKPSDPNVIKPLENLSVSSKRSLNFQNLKYSSNSKKSYSELSEGENDHNIEASATQTCTVSHEETHDYGYRLKFENGTLSNIIRVGRPSVSQKNQFIKSIIAHERSGKKHSKKMKPFEFLCQESQRVDSYEFLSFIYTNLDGILKEYKTHIKRRDRQGPLSRRDTRILLKEILQAKKIPLLHKLFSFTSIGEQGTHIINCNSLDEILARSFLELEPTEDFRSKIEKIVEHIESMLRNNIEMGPYFEMICKKVNEAINRKSSFWH